MTTTDAGWRAPDGARFGVREWRPGVAPRAVVLAMHGLGCRADDFAALGEALSRQGVALAAWNLRGQGLDPVVGRRGAWLQVDGLLEDMRNFGETIAAPGVPLFLCGESMGALLILQAAIRPEWRERIAGVVLLSPVVALAQKNPPWLKAALRWAAAAFPGLRLKPGWFIHGSGGMPKLTRVEERQRYLATAPHRLGALTLGFLSSIGDLIEASPGAAEHLQVPVAVFSAGRDVFTTPEQTREFFERIRSADKTHFTYDESYHQLLFDLDEPQVVAEAVGWLLSRISPR